MATLKKRGAMWVARVQWRDQNGQKKEKQTPLRTESEVTAFKRLPAVNKVEAYIKKGFSFSFPWMNDDGKIKVEYLTLEGAVEIWLKLRKSQGIASSTIERNRQSMNTIMSELGKSIRLSSVTTKSIERYTERMSLKGYKPNGININLRTLTTFLRWAYRRDDIDKLPFVPKVKVDEALPSYLSDVDFDRLIKETDEHFAKVFQMYRNNGCRLTEPIF